MMLDGIKRNYEKRDTLTGILDQESIYKAGQFEQMMGLWLRNQKNPTAKVAQEYYQKHILPVLPLPQQGINPGASKSGAVPPKPFAGQTKSGVKFTVE